MGAGSTRLSPGGFPAPHWEAVRALLERLVGLCWSPVAAHAVDAGYCSVRQTHEGDEALAQVAQRSCGCPLPGSVQGRVGWNSEHPGLVEDVPAHSRGVGTR